MVDEHGATAKRRQLPAILMMVKRGGEGGLMRCNEKILLRIRDDNVKIKEMRNER